MYSNSLCTRHKAKKTRLFSEYSLSSAPAVKLSILYLKQTDFFALMCLFFCLSTHCELLSNSPLWICYVLSARTSALSENRGKAQWLKLIFFLAVSNGTCRLDLACDMAVFARVLTSFSWSTGGSNPGSSFFYTCLLLHQSFRKSAFQVKCCSTSFAKKKPNRLHVMRYWMIN